jgi:hypothetical protein
MPCQQDLTSLLLTNVTIVQDASAGSPISLSAYYRSLFDPRFSASISGSFFSAFSAPLREILWHKNTF